MGPTNYPDLLPVSTMSYCPAFTQMSLLRYFTLFVIYTPYTIYKCKLAVERGKLQLTTPIPDSFVGWGKMVVRDGWKCG